MLTTVQGGLEELGWWRRACCLMSLAFLPKGDPHLGSRRRVCIPISAAERTDFTRAALEAGKSHSHFQVSVKCSYT